MDREQYISLIYEQHLPDFELYNYLTFLSIWKLYTVLYLQKKTRKGR